MSDSERRSSPRTGLVLKVEYPSLDGFVQDYTANISRGGTMICSRREVAIGQQLELVVSFPGLLRPIRLSGTVRWCRREGEGENAFGVEFGPDQQAAWPALAHLVERIVARDSELVAQSTLRVLVAEDNIHVANLIRRGLEAHLWRQQSSVAFDVRRAENGVDALDRLQEQHYDLLLADVFLPLMDGEALIRRLRADPRWERLPIVAFSAADSSVEQQILQAGADFFLPKPLRLADLVSTMTKLALFPNAARVSE